MSQPNIDVDEISEQVANKLSEKNKIGDKYLLSRRQLMAVASSGLAAAGIPALMSDSASAQTAYGSAGTADKSLEGYFTSLEADKGTIAQLKADNVVVDKDSNPSTHSAENISVQADESVVVFDLADPVDVLGGYYKAERTGAVTYEYDDGSTVLIGGQSTRSNDSGGDTYDIGKIYPAVDVVKVSVDILTAGNAAFHAATI